MKQVEKDNLVYESIGNCFLNGKRAKIMGRLLKFPIIGELDGDLTVEYSWEAVRNIMNEHNGQFSI